MSLGDFWRKCKLLLSSFYYISLKCVRQKELLKQSSLYRWFSARGEIMYGERLGHFVTFLKNKSYSNFIYIFYTFVLALGRGKET